jgi:hypothetical protein
LAGRRRLAVTDNHTSRESHHHEPKRSDSPPARRTLTRASQRPLVILSMLRELRLNSAEARRLPERIRSDLDAIGLGAQPLG